MAAYLIGAIDVEDADGYARYREGVGPLMQKMSGVELLSADDHPEIFEGTQPAGHLFVVKFASMNAVRQWLGSDDYRQFKAYRHNASTTKFIMAMRGPDER